MSAGGAVGGPAPIAGPSAAGNAALAGTIVVSLVGSIASNVVCLCFR